MGIWERAREGLCVAGILLGFFLLGIHSALLRPFWFDELSTLFMTNQPTLGGMFRAIPTDGNPPLYFLLARFFLQFPLRTELAMRLPALLGYVLGALSVYRFVRRDAGRTYALLSMSLFLGCRIDTFAIEARAYSLMLALTGLTICSWQYFCRSRKPIGLLGLAAGVIGAIFAHQYGVVYTIVPVFVGEAVRIVRRRSIDWPILLTLALSSSAVLFTFPTMLQAQRTLLHAIRTCPVFFAHPRLHDLRDYAHMVPLFAPVLFGVAALALILKIGTCGFSPREGSYSPPEDLAVAAALSLFLPFMLLLTHLGTNFFEMRYGLGSALGLSIMIGLLLSHLQARWRGTPELAWGGTSYGLAMACICLSVAAHPPGPAPWQDPVLESRDVQEPIVVASALEFSPMWWYAKEPMRAKLHYLSDPAYAGLHSDLIPEYSLALEQAYTPMQMDNYQTFLASHNRFLLYCHGEARLEWVKQRLMHEGWKLTQLRTAKLEPVGEEGQEYRELYEVTRQSSVGRDQ